MGNKTVEHTIAAIMIFLTLVFVTVYGYDNAKRLLKIIERYTVSRI